MVVAWEECFTAQDPDPALARRMMGTTTGYDEGGYAGERHEKKGMMEKIKEKLPGGGHH